MRKVFGGRAPSLFASAHTEYKATGNMPERVAPSEHRGVSTAPSAETLRTAIECAGESVLVTDAAGTILYVNPAFSKQTGYAPEEALGKKPNILKSGAQDADFYAALWKTVCSGQTWRGELVNRRKDGVHYDVAQTIAPVINAAGVIMGYVSIKRDVTEHKRAEREIAEHQSRMMNASRMAALGLVAGNIAHEIKNPLAVISGNAELLAEMCQSRQRDEKACMDATARIVRNVERLERIVRGLRNLSREGSRDPFVEYPLHALAAETIELCLPRFNAKEVRLTCHPIPLELRVECRPTQISQALLNLLTNALDAVPTHAQQWVHIECEEAEDAVILSVTDSGRGVPESLREAIFQEFCTTKNDGVSCGLGLSISRAIVEAHEGRLYLDDTASHTRFVMRLPKKQPSSALRPADALPLAQ